MDTNEPAPTNTPSLEAERVNVRITIITPTIGRPSLERTIESAMRCGFSKSSDEMIVVGDGPQPEGRRIAGLFEGHGVRYMEVGPDHCFGHPQRNAAMASALGTHLAFMDDDDEYADGALDHMREVLSQNPLKMAIFRAQVESPKRLLWRVKSIRVGNVSTQMVAVPNIPTLLGVWERRYAGDYDFIWGTAEKLPNGAADVVWSERVVAIIPRASRGAPASKGAKP